MVKWRSTVKNSKKKPKGKEYEMSEEELRRRNKELEKENAELREANNILKDALGFFAKDRKR